MSTSSSTPSAPQIIGVAGTFASGKDLLAHYLSDHFGYTHPSTSELVRNVAMKEEGSVERDVLQRVATRYRQQHGAGVFAQMALDSVPRPTVVTGLRSLGEANAIKRAGGVIVFVDAPIEMRYERMQARERDAEVHLTLDEFKASEKIEWHGGDDEADFNLKGIKAMADIVIDSSPGREAYLDNSLKALGIR